MDERIWACDICGATNRHVQERIEKGISIAEVVLWCHGCQAPRDPSKRLPMRARKQLQSQVAEASARVSSNCRAVGGSGFRESPPTFQVCALCREATMARLGLVMTILDVDWASPADTQS